MSLITGHFPLGHFPAGAFPTGHWPLPPSTEAEEEAFSISNLIGRIRQITARDNVIDLTDIEIESYIYKALREITKRTLCLKDSLSSTLLPNVEIINLPDGMIPGMEAIDNFYINGSLYDPLSIEESQYKYRHAGKWINLYRGYCLYDGSIHVTPTDIVSRNYKLYYSKYHPSSGSILVGDEFKMAIIYYCCSKVYGDYGNEEKENEYEDMFESELDNYVSEEIDIVRCRALQPV